jgi:hypothetical protein
MICAELRKNEAGVCGESLEAALLLAVSHPT